MGRNPESNRSLASRRRFLADTAAMTAAGICLPLFTRYALAEPPQTGLRFIADGDGFRFDTGALRGTLRDGGRSLGLIPVTDVPSGTLLSRSMGLCSHYRLLDDTQRYGTAGWSWASQASLLEDGAVRVQWTADNEHPFSMQAVYRWSAARTLDVETTVTARQSLKRMEVFLASYFEGFAPSFAYVQHHPGRGDQPGLMEADRTQGVWQMFPRDEAAVATIQDGRWKRPPNPVDWQIMPELAGPLGVRRDAATGLTALVMSPPDDCFAVATPYSEESHRSIYLSLFGRDFAEGESHTARARLVIDQDITDERAVEMYEDYAGIASPTPPTNHRRE